MKSHIPNILTLLRIAMIPPLVLWLCAEPGSVWPLVMYAVIALTDFLDGYLARRWQVTSEFGAFLDPAADKLLVVSVLMTMAVEHASMWFTAPAMIIIARELVMSMLREWLAKKGLGHITAVDVVGKYKTTAQMVSLGAFMIPVYSVQMLGYGLLYVAMVLSCFSLGRYLSKLDVTALVPKTISAKLIHHTSNYSAKPAA